MTQILCLLIPFVFICSPAWADTYYINQNTQSSSPDGSRDKPYVSLEQAVGARSASSLEFVLLGNNVSLTGVLTFVSGISYKIRPDTGPGSYFPLMLLVGTNIRATTGNVTFEDIELIEKDSARTASNQAILFKDSHLTLSRVLLRNINYSTTVYKFLQTQTSSTSTIYEANIINSTFANLQNSQIIFTGVKTTITGSNFTNLFQEKGIFIYFVNVKGAALGITLKGIRLENCTLGTMASTAFIYVLLSATNMVMDNFYMKNITFTSEYPLLYLANSKQTYTATSLTLTNWAMEDIYERSTTTLQTSMGIIIHSMCTFHTIENVTVNNLQLRMRPFLGLNSVPGLFLNVFTVLPSVNINNLTITNSINANIIIYSQDNVIIQNVRLENHTFYSPDLGSPIFTLDTINSALCRNIQAIGNVGILISFNNVLKQEVYGLNVENHFNSEDLPTTYQNILVSQRLSTPEYLQLNTTQETGTIIENFNINGFSELGGINVSSRSNNSYALYVSCNYGNISLKDSVWMDIELGGVLTAAAEFFQIDNLTVDSNTSIPTQEIANHNLLQFMNVREAVIRNSLIQNNRNFQIFSLVNLNRQDFYETLNLTTLTFQNLNIINNSANLEVNEFLLKSFFRFYSPLKPVKITFSNCSFIDNQITTGLIGLSESYNIEIHIMDNLFQGNYGSQSGSVLYATSMEQTISSMQITNNKFINNYCESSGGIFYFSGTQFSVKSSNNVYFNNSAGNGGVGFARTSKLLYLEENGTYYGNSASKSGGSWSLSLRRNSLKTPSFNMTNVTFENLAARDGGAIYVSTGDVSISNANFKNNTAQQTGGDIFLFALCSIRVQNTNFSSGSAEVGSLFYGQSLSNETVTFNNIHVTSYKAKDGTDTSSLFMMHSGTIILSNSDFQGISLHLFNLQGVTANLNNLIFSQITCSSSDTACFLEGYSTDINLSQTQINEITTNQNFIRLVQSNSVNLTNVVLSNGKLAKNVLIPDQKALMILSSVKQSRIEECTFENFNFSSLKIAKSNIEIIKTVFSNKPSQRFLLRSSSPALNINKNIQFLTLDSSNSSITQTSFIRNSPTNSLNGGAMRIFGTGGNHHLSEVIFFKNHGSNGGALSVEGSAYSLNIDHCEFSNNTAGNYGGAIYFANQSVSSVVTLSQSAFTSNQASLGGGIFIVEQRLLLSNSTFLNNNATLGGAIASQGPVLDSVSLQGNTFSSNTAQQGSALMSFNNMVFDYSTSKFEGNTAEYGADVTSIPKKVRMRIFEVREAFLFIDNVEIEYMISDYGTQLIYDSINPSIYSPLEQKPGREPNFIFEITLLDALGQTSPFFEQGSLTLGISSTSGSTSGSDLFGRSDYTLKAPTTYIFNSFSLRGSFGAIITLSAIAKIFSSVTNQIEPIETFEWNVTIGLCHPGETYSESTSVCSPCLEDTYSLGDPFTSKTCEPCPKHAVCRGGGIMYPTSGYWRMSNYSDRFVKCRQNEACLGGEQDEGKNISLEGFCNKGYEGVACSACTEGYAKFGTSHKCVNCKTDANYYLRFGGYLIIHIASIILATKANIFKAGATIKTKKEEMLQATFTKLLIDFVQVMNLVLQFDFDWPNILDTLLTITAIPEPTNRDAISIDCFIALIKQKNTDVFYIKLVAFTFQPIFYMLLAYLFWIVYYRLIKKTNTNLKVFKDNVKITMISIVYILQPDIIKTTFQIFDCKNFGSSAATEYFLLEDTHVNCWTQNHLIWILAVGLPSILLWLVLPYGVLIRWITSKKRLEAQRFRNQYVFIFGKYNEKFSFWELVIMGEKLLIVIFSVFLESTYYQAYLSFFLILMIIQLHIRFKPYFDDRLNRAEILSLWSLATIIYSGLYYLQSDKSESIIYLILVIDVVFAGVFLGYSGYVLLPIIKTQLVKIKNKIKRATTQDHKDQNILEQQYKDLRPNLVKAVKLGKYRKGDTPSEVFTKMDYADCLSDEKMTSPFGKNSLFGERNEEGEDSFAEMMLLKRSYSFSFEPTNVRLHIKRAQSCDDLTSQADELSARCPSLLLSKRGTSTERNLTTQQFFRSLTSRPDRPDTARTPSTSRSNRRDLLAGTNLRTSRFISKG